MSDNGYERIKVLADQNKELAARFEYVNASFWQTVNDDRARRRAQAFKRAEIRTGPVVSVSTETPCQG